MASPLRGGPAVQSVLPAEPRTDRGESDRGHLDQGQVENGIDTAGALLAG